MKAATDWPLPDLQWPPLAPLWQAARRNEFRLPCCAACGRFDWYPSGACTGCGGTEIHWRLLSGRGSLYSWAVVNRALHPPLAALGPYIAAIVATAEDPSVRFVTRMVDIDPSTLRIDMPVRVCFADAGHPVLSTGVTVPLFTAGP